MASMYPPRRSIMENAQILELPVSLPVYTASENIRYITTSDIFAQPQNRGLTTMYNQVKILSIVVRWVPNTGLLDGVSSSTVLTVENYAYQSFFNNSFVDMTMYPGACVRKSWQNLCVKWYPTSPEQKGWNALSSTFGYMAVVLRCSSDSAYLNGVLLLDVRAKFRGRFSKDNYFLRVDTIAELDPNPNTGSNNNARDGEIATRDLKKPLVIPIPFQSGDGCYIVEFKFHYLLVAFSQNRESQFEHLMIHKCEMALDAVENINEDLFSIEDPSRYGFWDFCENGKTLLDLNVSDHFCNGSDVMYLVNMGLEGNERYRRSNALERDVNQDSGPSTPEELDMCKPEEEPDDVADHDPEWVMLG